MCKLKKNILLFLLIGFIVNAYSQNLINNGDFENYKRKKKWKIPVSNLKDCYNPNNATPDLLTPYSKNTLYAAPKNCGGFQLAHSGDTYIGLNIYTGKKSYDYDNNNEYISIKLKETLKRGRLYCISMYVSLGDTCYFASEGLDAYFSKEIKSIFFPKFPYFECIRAFVLCFKPAIARYKHI